MEKRNFHARNARVNLLKILKEGGSLMLNGVWLTGFFWKKFPWPASREQFQSQKDGFSNMLKKTRWSPKGDFSAEERQEGFHWSWWNMDICRQQRKWHMDMACVRKENRSCCRMSCRKERWCRSFSSMGISFWRLQKERNIFHGRPVLLRKSISSRQTQSCRQRKRENKSYREA